MSDAAGKPHSMVRGIVAVVKTASGGSRYAAGQLERVGEAFAEGGEV